MVSAGKPRAMHARIAPTRQMRGWRWPAGGGLSVPLLLGYFVDRTGIGMAFSIVALLLLVALALAVVATRPWRCEAR